MTLNELCEQMLCTPAEKKRLKLYLLALRWVKLCRELL